MRSSRGNGHRGEASMIPDTMAIDQYGQLYRDLGRYPRKALLERLGCKHADRIYRDDPLTKDVRHVGYIIGRLWLTIYTVTEWKGGKV